MNNVKNRFFKILYSCLVRGGAMKTLRFAFLPLLIFLFSCKNDLNIDSNPSEPKSENHIVKCFISMSSAVPEELVPAVSNESLQRSAIPTVNTTDYYYFVEAVKSDGTEIKFYGKEYENIFKPALNGTIGFELSLSVGEWDVTCGVKNNSDETVLSQTLPQEITADDVIVNLHFVVRPQEGGFGKIQLEFSTDGLSSDFSVSRIMAECNSPAWKSANEDSTKRYLITTSGKATLNVPSIASGAYQITFTFYDSSSIILYQTTQTINVLAGMTTKRWVSGGGADDAVIDEGKLTLNADAINDFARRIFYVGDTTHGTASSDGEGTAYRPFNSLEKALATIEKTKSSSKDYTIHLTGTQTAQSTMASGRAWVVPAGIKSLTIVGDKGLNASGMPDAVLNGNKKGSVLEAKSNLILKNVQITGGYANGSGAAQNGGGIYIDSGVNVTLDSGTLIGDVIIPEENAAATKSSCGNYAYNYGGGIHMEDATLVVKSGAKICHNYTGRGASSSLNFAGRDASGGGISCKKGTITLEDGSSVSYNGTEVRGGGIYLPNPISGNTVLVMDGADVSHNETIGWGGGIYMGDSNVKVTIKDSSVSYNKCVGTNAGWGPAGGGFFIDGGNLTIKGNSIIERNETYYGCGAIDPRNTCSISFEGGIIRNNTASSGCGAISLSSGKTYNFSGSIYIPYGIDGDTSKGKNGLVLGEGAVINVAGPLTSSEDVIATITPEKWSRGTQVLAGNYAGVSVNRFAITDEEFEIKKKGDGSSATGILNAPICVAASDSTRKATVNEGALGTKTWGAPSADSTARGTRSQPFAKMSQVLSQLTDNTVPYEILINGTIKGKDIACATFDSSKVGNITIRGVNGALADSTTGAPYDVLDADNLASSGYERNVTVLSFKGTSTQKISATIQDLKITGANNFASTNSGVRGGGINASYSDITLAKGALITGNYGYSGGGIYLVNGNLFMYANACIGEKGSGTATGTSIAEGQCSNYSRQNGGGIYCDNGHVYLGYKNSTTVATDDDKWTGGIYRNYEAKDDETNGGGGGIYLGSGAELSMAGEGFVSRNMTKGEGGGIYVSAGSTKAEISGGKIEENKTDAEGNGGGICNYKILNIIGGEINGNSAKQGAGIYNGGESSELSISGGIISNNIADNKGGAIYAAKTFKFGGAITIPYGGAEKSNDIYLADSTYIKITSELSNYNSSEWIINNNNRIYVTPYDYSYKREVLKYDSPNFSYDDFKNEVLKFKVTATESPYKYFTLYENRNWGNLTLSTSISLSDIRNYPGCTWETATIKTDENDFLIRTSKGAGSGINFASLGFGVLKLTHDGTPGNDCVYHLSWKSCTNNNSGVVASKQYQVDSNAAYQNCDLGELDIDTDGKPDFRFSIEDWRFTITCLNGAKYYVIQ